MQQPGQVRRRGAWDFQGYYDYVCAAQGSTPVPAVQVRVGRGELDLNADRVQQSDWPAILDALSINTQLQGVAIRSAHLSAAAGPVVGRWSVRRKTPALHTRGVALALCRAVRRCLAVSGSLRTLELSGLSLREADLTALTKGLMKSAALEHLSLARCPIADRGLEVICQGVKFSSSIKTLDFSYCNITWQGAEHLANIIKHQAVCRHSAAWAESLRYRKAEFEVMAGLRRLTLNGNILIGDEGAAAIARELAEDLWVKAVDLQRCGLSNVGGTALLQAVQSNRCLCVLDVRNNPLVDNSLVKDIITRVLMNTVNSSDTQYLWIKPPTSGNPVRNTRRASHRTSLMSKKASGSVPWRTAARAGLQNAATSARTRHDLQGAASVKVALESEEEEELEEVDQRGEEKISSGRYGRLKVALEECQLRLTEERNARMQANSRLVE